MCGGRCLAVQNGVVLAGVVTMDVMRSLHATTHQAEWMSRSSGVKRERPIGPRKSSRGRIGGPESLKPLVALTIYTSFTAKSSLFIDLPIGFRSCVMRR